jgi:hypothetical protein
MAMYLQQECQHHPAFSHGLTVCLMLHGLLYAQCCTMVPTAPVLGISVTSELASVYSILHPMYLHLEP